MSSHESACGTAKAVTALLARSHTAGAAVAGHSQHGARRFSCLFLLCRLISSSRSLILLAATLFVVSGCSDSPERWEETVRSPDGRAFLLTRHQEFTFGGGVGETFDKRVPSDYWLEFDLRPGYRVRWEQTENHVGTVALLSTADDRLYMLTMPLKGHREYGCPNPPYLLWRHMPSTSHRGIFRSWYRVPLEEIPYKRVESNMTFGADQERRGRYNYRKWLMDFSRVQRQSFGDCNVAADDLIVD